MRGHNRTEQWSRTRPQGARVWTGAMGRDGALGNNLRKVVWAGQSATLLEAQTPLADARRSGNAGSVRSDAATAGAGGLQWPGERAGQR